MYIERQIKSVIHGNTVLLTIYYDEFAENPRKYCDNLSSIYLFGPNLSPCGDPHAFESPGECLVDLVLENLSKTEIDRIFRNLLIRDNPHVYLDRRAEDDRIIFSLFDPDKSVPDISICDIVIDQYGDYKNQAVEAALLHIQYVAFDTLYEMAQRYAVILPITAYVHSGKTIRPATKAPKLSSASDGIALIEFAKFRENVNVASSEEINLMGKMINAEIDELDRYFTGEVYGVSFQIDDNEAESVWGINIPFDELPDYCRSLIPKEYEDILHEWDQNSAYEMEAMAV